MSWPARLWARLQSLGFVVFAAVVVAGLALMFLPLLQRRHSLQAETRRLDVELARQEALEKQQKIEIEALRTDPAFVERSARDKLNVARPDETVFRFEPAQTNAVSRAPRPR